MVNTRSSFRSSTSRGQVVHVPVVAAAVHRKSSTSSTTTITTTTTTRKKQAAVVKATKAKATTTRTVKRSKTRKGTSTSLSAHKAIIKSIKKDDDEEEEEAPAPAAPPALSTQQYQQKASASEHNLLLLELHDDDIVLGELRCRPSKRNRSPYVGDVFLPHEKREAVVHLPSLDMGGKCQPGVQLLMKPARDKKGNLIGPNAVSPKYGTPKCEFIAQLVRVDESHLSWKQGKEEKTPSLYEPVWVGAHPALGEKIAEQLIGRNLLGPNFPDVESFQREVRNVGGMDMRADFVVQHVDKSLPRRVVEVKTVVDTDYAVGAVPDNVKCVYTSDAPNYVRTGIFPWGSVSQKGPNGEAVVSARAIKHVRELTKLAQGKQAKGDEKYDATVLFVVIRGDAKQFRPNHEACPSFAKYLKEAEQAGVQVLAKQVCWGEQNDMGKCFEGDLLDVIWP